MNTYTCVYSSVARNLSATALSLLMKSQAPLFVDTYTEAGLTLVSDTASASDPKAIRTIVFHDAGSPGSIPPGAPMAEYLTNTMTGSIATGIQAPVVAAPVAVT